MLDDAQRTLFARHLLLAEIGEAGQAALCSATVHACGGADARAAEIARDYLERAGVAWTEGAVGHEVEIVGPEELARVRPELRDAAAAVAGAFAAVEAIKRIAGVGVPGTLDLELLT